MKRARNNHARAKLAGMAIIASAALVCGGCPGLDINVNGDITLGIQQLERDIGRLQDRNPHDIDLPDVLVNQGDTIVINNDVTVVQDIRQDLVVADLPDQTVLGFENLTGWDIFVTYTVNGDEQTIYVYDGETLLLEYPCLDEVELLFEDDIDPFDGSLVDSFDLSGSVFFNPDDFICGDALVLTFDPEAVSASAEAIDLLH